MISSVAYSLGYGSGIDVAKLVTELAAASREPKVARFDARAKAVQASISAVAQARSDLDTFATSLAGLVASGSLQSQPSVADSSVVEARAIAGRRLSNFSSSIEVTQLARGQTLASGFVPSAIDPVGQGTLTLTVGAMATTVTVGSTNDSLNGLAAAINDARTGVIASVVTDTAGARLVLKGPTGAASAFSLSSADPGLAGFAHSGAMTLVQAAQNAEFKVDGLAYVRPSNTVEDILPGVALTLKKIAVGTPVQISVARAGDTLKTTLTDFVSVFNEVKSRIAEASAATRGDQAMRTLDRHLSQLVAQSVSSGIPASLSAIGVATNRDGTIAFDAVAFDAAYALDPDAVEAIFSPTRDAGHTVVTDPGISGALSALKAAVTASNGSLSNLSSRLGKEASAIANDRARMEARETAYQARLEQQFGQVDARVAALKATQSYLDQQIKIWTKSSD